jgi:tetratricopeptide (TPR) repeat protein
LNYESLTQMPQGLPDADDIEDFLKKVTDIERQLKGLQEGTIEPKDVHAPGDWAMDAAAAKSSTARAIQSARLENQVNEEEAEKARNRALQAKWDRERGERLQKEEADKWWRFARLQFGDDGVNAPIETPVEGQPLPPPRRRAPPGPINYAWWDKYVEAPDDAVSKAEREKEAYNRERAQDEAFEKANPGFCAQFRSDAEKRALAEEQKKRKAEGIKEKGNAAFKTQDYRTALNLYHDAIKISPFNVSALGNIAACQLALQNWDGVLEYTNRVLFIEPYGNAPAIKALFRRAHAKSQNNKWVEAKEDLLLASSKDPKNAEVNAFLKTVSLEVAEAEREKEVIAKLELKDGMQESSISSNSETSSLNTKAAEQQASLSSRISAAAMILSKTSNSLKQQELRQIALLLTNDDERVLCRSSGLIEYTCSSICASVKAILRNENAIGSFYNAERLSEGFLLLTCVVQNAKNRLIVRKSGALSGALDLLTVDSKRLSELLTSNLSQIDELLVIALALSELFLKPGVDDDEGRILVSTHAFVKGQWRSSESMNRLDCVGRLSEICTLLQKEVTVSAQTLEIASGCSTLLQMTASSSIRVITESVSGYKDALSISNNPISILLHFLTTLIGRALFDEALLSSQVTQAVVGALGSLALHEDLRSTFATILARPHGIEEDKNKSPLETRDFSERLRENVKHAREQATRLGASAKMGGIAGVEAAKLDELIAEAELVAKKSSIRRTNFSNSPPPALHSLLDLLRLPVPVSPDWNSVRGTALGALANACVNQPNVVKALVSLGAVDVLIGMLLDESESSSSSSSSSLVIDENSLVLAAETRSRGALLLGRVFSVTEVTDKLEVVTAQLTSLLSRSTSDSIPVIAGIKAAKAVYEDGLVKILAAAIQTSLTSADAFVVSGGIVAISKVLKEALPTLRNFSNNTGKVPRSTVIGNACVLLLNVCSKNGDAMLTAGLCDLAVEFLKAPGDEYFNLRRNASLLVARLVKSGIKCEERIRSLRGMEILLTLERDQGFKTLNEK